MPLMTQEAACAVFLSSIDLGVRSNYEVMMFTPESEFDVEARITTKTFSDGAPAIKFFHRDDMAATFTFEAGKTYSVVALRYHSSPESVHWYCNNIWYQLLRTDNTGDELWEILEHM